MQANRPSILLIGTGHWSNPGLDYKSVEFDDMLSPARQAEIAECLDQLGRFRPTRVALEIMPRDEAAWNDEFVAYREGRFALTANERHQLGFRLAALAGLDRISGIDWHDLDRPIGWDRAIDYAREHGQEQFIEFFLQLDRETPGDQAAEAGRIRQTSVREQLLGDNDPAAMAASHRVYMDQAQIGHGDTYVGAEVILRWYERNMRMFVNIARLATDPGDRVAVVVGAGHLPLLTHFLLGADRYHLEPVSDYLR